MKKLNILIADTETAFRESLIKELHTCDFCGHIHTAASMKTALSCIEHRQIDILITDLFLNGGDGITLIRQLHQQNPGAIILLGSILLRGDIINHSVIPKVDLMFAKPCSADDVKDLLLSLYQDKSVSLYRKRNLEFDITNMLRDLGVSPSMKGYSYLKRAVYIAITNPDAQSVTKWIYPAVEKEFGCGNVERPIRYAVRRAWEQSGSGTWFHYFSQAELKGKRYPSNSTVIYGLAEYYRTHVLERPESL